MKTFYSVIFLPFLIILLLVTPVIGSDWVEYGRDNIGNVFLYNKVNIKHRTQGIIRVLLKVVFSTEGKEKTIEDYRNRTLSTEGYNKLSHSLFLKEIDCKNERSRFLHYTDYDTDGKVLYTQTYDEPSWTYIVPGLVFDNLQKKVCVTRKKPLKKK